MYSTERQVAKDSKKSNRARDHGTAGRKDVIP